VTGAGVSTKLIDELMAGLVAEDEAIAKRDAAIAAADDFDDERLADLNDKINQKEQKRTNQEKYDLICSTFDRSELGNSSRFCTRYGDDVRFCHPLNQWYIWTGKRWERDQSGRVLEI
jgi:DNA-binding transcriptional MerR regulator